MDAVLLARIQFALTIGFHYIFPPLSIGLAWMLFIYQVRFLKTGNPIFQQLSRFWTRMFAITFALGVATGITMEFQFGTNWAAYSRFVGDIFGAPLAAEGVFAFFLESSFLAVLLYGEKRVSRRMYCISSFLVAAGATLSAFWIVVANSWQQTPAGYHLMNGRAELTSFWEAVFNPSTLPRYCHVITGALTVGIFFVLGVSALMLLKRKHVEFAERSLKSALIPAFVTIMLVGVVGHWHAVQVAETQPAKLAAFEGLWETQTEAPLLLFGVPNAAEERTDFAIPVPGLLSYVVAWDTGHEVQGLKDFPVEDRPPLLLTFFSFHFMVYLGGWFILIATLGLILWWRGKVTENKLFLLAATVTIPLPFIANELGWMAAEIGRQPWVVYNLMRTKDAVSGSVPAGQILASIIMFSLIYSLLFGVWIYLLGRQFNKGPQPLEEETC
ncbi:MAG: cytochrome ubiquinol oxidase subunit I [Verrucomicrobia bacterium]|jgi:cytochrome bd ubiquinol oxidase subunit I|nr:cytochrome ubiquinol oxidase subunit I [Verrucomicrobiota bacterium]